MQSEVDLDALEALRSQVCAGTLSRSWMYACIRHGQRNMDFETSDDGEEPDRYAGEAIADILNALPALIAELRDARRAAVLFVVVVIGGHGASVVLMLGAR